MGDVRFIGSAQRNVGVTFLSPNKKVTKEIGIGEALTVKPIVPASIVQNACLAFKPPSPMYPTRPSTKPGW